MRKLCMAGILALWTLSAGAMQITSSLTSSSLTVSAIGTSGTPAGFTTDPTGLSPSEWTDLANWELQLTVFDGHASADVTNYMYGTLAPYTQLEWTHGLTMAWSGGLNPDGSPEVGFWTFSSCGSPPAMPPGCGDHLKNLGAGSGQDTFVGAVVLSNATDQPVPFYLYGAMHAEADSMVPTPVPEPSTGALLLAGAAMLALALRRRRQAVASRA